MELKVFVTFVTTGVDQLNFLFFFKIQYGGAEYGSEFDEQETFER